MTAVSIPFAEEAETICAGLAAVGRKNAAVVLERLSPSDCYLPKHRRILEHALDQLVLAAEDRATGDKLEARVAALARVAEVDITYVAILAEDWASYGRRFSAPRQVAEAARCRELMAVAADLYNGAGTLLADDLVDLCDRVRQLREDLAQVPTGDHVELTLIQGSAA